MRQRPDILAIGHAPALRVNRAVYRSLTQQGFSVELVVPVRLPQHASNQAIEAAEAGDPPLHWLPLRGENLRYYRFVGLRQLLDRRRPHIIHLENEPDTVLAWWLGRWARDNNAILTCQMLENALPAFLPTLLRGQIAAAARALRTQSCSRLTRARLAAVFCHNRDAAQIATRLGFGEKVTLVPVGFDPALFCVQPQVRHATRAELGLTETTIAYFGRQVPAKGVHVLLNALGELRDLPWQLLLDEFEGSDSYTSSLRALMQSHQFADRCVQFHASHSEIFRYMNAADICVVPSLWKEQFGRVASEAMACGKAVVASNSGALPDVLGEAGLLVPPGDAAALRDTLRTLLNDTQLRTRLGEEAALRARALLSVEAQAKAMGGTFTKLLTQRQG